MKKLMSITILIFSLVLVLAACRKDMEDNPVPAPSGDAVKQEGMLPEKDMTDTKDVLEEKEMSAQEDRMEKQDDMTDGKSGDAMEKDTKDDSAMMNEGEIAPSFTFMTLDGDTVSLDDLKGEKVYVKFWASWCPICIGGLEEIDTLTAEVEGFQVITVVTPNFRGEKSVEDFKAWYDPMKTPNLTVLLDVDGSYAKEFGVRAYPTSVYIGSDSTLIKVAPGHVDNETIQETIETFY